jgi:hypothetical protein
MITQDQQRQAIREQLIKEFNAPEKPKKNHKQSVSLCKRESPRSRFLKKEGNKPVVGDKITYMLVEKKAPKVKPDFIPITKITKRRKI